MKLKKHSLFFVLSTALLLAACSTGSSSSNTPSIDNSTSTSIKDSTSSTTESKASSTGTSKNSTTQNSTSKTTSTTSNQQVSKGFAFDNSITQAQSIHTTDQKKMIEWGKTHSFYNDLNSSVLTSLGASGRDEKSHPNQVTVKWTYGAPEGKTVKDYSLTFGQKSDLSDGYTVKGTTASQISFYNSYIGDNYFKVTANFTDGTSEASEIKTFKVDGTAPRIMKIGSMSNCRDMGGRTTAAGGRVKQGLIYRTADPEGKVNDEVKEVMLNHLKVKSEIYVKDGRNSSSPLGSSVKYYNCSMDYGNSAYSNLSRNAERIRKVFSILADQNNYPTFYHCRIGTDRTGIVAILLNGLLGVDFNETIGDHAFSNYAPIDGQRYANSAKVTGQDPNGDDIAKYVDEILAMPGKNFQEKTYYSLLSIGIPAADLAKIIDFLTEGPKATLPTDFIIGKGADLTTSGGSKKTSTDFTHPETYYDITNGQSVSFKFNLTAKANADIVAYMGNTTKSSTKIANGISLKIDGAEKTIVDKTHENAGFGRTSQNGRTAYMFNQLGQYELEAGEHTVTITGKSSEHFNVGVINVIGGAAGSSNNPSSGPTGGSETHTHSFGTLTDVAGNIGYKKGTCACGATKLVIKSTDGTFASGSVNKSGTPSGYIKLSENNQSISYTFNYDANKSGKIYLDGVMDSWSGNASKTFYSQQKGATNGNFRLEVNGTAVDYSDKKDVTFETMFANGTPTSLGSTYSNQAEVEVGNMALKSGSNVIKFTRLDSFNVLTQNIVIVLEK